MEKICINYDIIKNIKSELRLKNVIEVEINKTMSKLFNKVKSLNNLKFSTELGKVRIDVNPTVYLLFKYDYFNRYNNQIFNIEVITI